MMKALLYHLAPLSLSLSLVFETRQVAGRGAETHVRRRE